MTGPGRTGTGREVGGSTRPGVRAAVICAAALLLAACTADRPEGPLAAGSGRSTTASPAATPATETPPAAVDEPTTVESSSREPDRAPAAPRAKIGAPTMMASPAPVPSRTAKPTTWPGFAFDGPADLDVCQAGQFPFDRLLTRDDGEEGGAEPESLVIRSAQAGLRSLNYGTPDPVQATGYFDAVTERALRSFQERKGLTVDGTIGPETWEALHYWVNAYEGNCP